MILLINNGSPHLKELKQYLQYKNIVFHVAQPRSHLASVMKHRYIGVILSGGPLMYDSPICISDVEINFAVLLDLDVPVLGICFGHQSIAEAYGGEVKRLAQSRHGIERIIIIKKSPLFVGLPPSLDMLEAHTDYVSKVPYNFVITALSQTGIEGMQHKKKNIFGVQFHPEASGVQGKKIIDNFLQICSKQRSSISK